MPLHSSLTTRWTWQILTSSAAPPSAMTSRQPSFAGSHSHRPSVVFRSYSRSCSSRYCVSSLIVSPLLDRPRHRANDAVLGVFVFAFDTAADRATPIILIRTQPEVRVVDGRKRLSRFDQRVEHTVHDVRVVIEYSQR